MSQLFSILPYKKKFDANKIKMSTHGYPYVVRTSVNNGQRGYIEEDPRYLNDGNTISFGQDTATMFYQEKPYFTGDKIKILKPTSNQFDKYNAQFIIAALNKAFSSFGWGSARFSVDVLNEQKVNLPITDDGEVDYASMSTYIKTYEAKRINSLDKYLTDSGLNNYQLTMKELSSVSDFKNGGV